ncbi:replication protein A 70 kDa DNA-binding subunit B [Tanacetum coccineum]
MVGSIRESGYEHEAIMYAHVHMIHVDNGWTYMAANDVVLGPSLIDSLKFKSKTSSQSSSKTSGESSSFAAWHNTSKPPKASKQLWWCKRHELIEAVGPKYKVIVRVIDETCSASLLLFDDMIHKLVGVPCYKLKEQYGPNVKMMCENPKFIKHFKKDFITEDEDDVLETPAPTVGTRHNKLQYQDSLPFNLEVTPPSAKGKEVASSASVEAENGDHQSERCWFLRESNGNGSALSLTLYDI